ncbi:MAG: hypothetical protein A2W25_09700 [candidate division Zixibacteria bacterium RBG_16_53_22]|nr:MAG: hypothetical protein A2W25_09700 [candidate division Zixibacteria bacterium RBG_16_53_22]
MRCVLPLRQRYFPILLSLCISAFLVPGCSLKKEKPVRQPRMPYPDEKMSIYLQGKVDSMQFLWFKDIKATASAFCNDEMRSEGSVSTADVVVLSEELFHARAEVRLPNKVLLLTMERPFKHRGKDSIWQVTKMEEKSVE